MTRAPLNFFQFERYLHAWAPRVDVGEPDPIKPAVGPWARPRSGLTLLMEAMMVLPSRWQKPAV